MFPFSKSRTQRVEECDHEWEEYEQSMAHPQNFYFEEGQPFIHKITVRGEECVNCSASKEIESSEEKVYFSVDRVEEIA